MSEADKPQSKQVTLDQIDAPQEKERDSRTDSWRIRDWEEGSDPEVRQQAEYADTLVGQIVAERYAVRRILGVGGMGAVYEAEHVQLKKLVALKVLHGTMSSNEEVVARFEREAFAAGRLDHPGIVAATDFGRLDDGSFYLALEFVDGESLADVLAREGALASERALGIASQITDALWAAHEEGIVHRDLKPDNVMLARTDDEGDFVKVVDFGIAKVRLDDDHKEGLTRAGLVFGTPEYMSPEQAMGHDADARSDLYGVGMLLYEMLAGTSPFRSDDVTAMLTAQIKEPPPPLSEEIPATLREIVRDLLQKNPDVRPESAAILAARLERVAQDLSWDMPLPRTSPGTRIDFRRRQPSSHRPPPIRIEERPSLAVGALHSVQHFSMRPVAIGKKHVPLFVPFLGLAVGVALGAVAMLTNAEVVPADKVEDEAELVDAEAQLIADASGGDRDAISALRKLTIFRQKELQSQGLILVTTKPEGKPEGADDTQKLAPASQLRMEDEEKVQEQANRYMVLGRGYSAIKHHSAAVEMYRSAVQLDPHLSEDTELLLDIRTAIAARDAVDDGLDFALHALGAHGADLIFDVYSDHMGQAGMTPVVARAMRIAQSDELLAQATPELKVALRLERAKLCGEFRDVLPDAVKYADARSLPKLEVLAQTKGCGADRQNDCFICLRKEDVPLNAALERAKSHPSPDFLTDAPAENKAAK